MKNFAFIFLALVLFVSCQKGELPGDNGCITQIRRHYIGGADSLAAINLFKQNQIPYTNLAFDRIILNDTVSNTGGTNIYQHIFALRYFNGLPLFFEETGYHFRNGIFQSEDGNTYSAPSPDTRSALSLAQLRNLYVQQVNKNDKYIAVADSCLVAEHGYYNVSIGTGNNTPTLAKGWLVTPAHAMYPQALFRDDQQGELILYFNGIYTFDKVKARQSPSLK